MSIGHNIQGWRLSRSYSIAAFSEKAHLSPASLEGIESGDVDPSVSMLERLAGALGIPPAWLYGDPKHFDLLTADPDEDESALPMTSVDPILERMVLASREERGLYVLLTALLQSGEPKLLRAAEVNLRSLVKQSKQATVPWETRPPGHFEPPSD